MVGQKITNKTSVKPLSLCICQSCKSTSHDTFQLLCEHCICKTCISNTSGDSITCTQCQRSTTKNSITLCSHPHPHGPLIINCESNQADFNPSLICEFCSKQFTSNIRLDEHKQKECNKITQPCPLVDYGCLSSVRRVELAEHYLSDVHQNTIITVVRRLSMKPTNDQSERASTMDVDIAPGTAGSTAATTTTIETLSTGMVEVYEAINTLASSKEALDASIRRISSESVRLQSSVESLIQGLASLKSSVEEQSTFIEGVKPNQDMLQQEVASLKQKVDDAQYVSYDGTLIWKITNFQEKMRDAQSERQTSIYSPPFYSSLSGYKMCARLYLHGDGNARGTHMSLFFVLMRGPNDAVLKFPFNYKVTFCLYDQTPQQRHIIDSFRPDLKSNSFQRPRSEMNIAAGIPTFFPLAMIQQDGNPYVRDDTMFIKIMVDFRGMDGSLLPYTLSLNPGLPMHIQQLLIKREEERRNEQ